jgi:hypothetical protein
MSSRGFAFWFFLVCAYLIWFAESGHLMSEAAGSVNCSRVLAFPLIAFRGLI